MEDSLRRLAASFRAMREAAHCDRWWWAHNDPVAYVWLRRAERRGAVVPWSPQ